VLALGFPGGVAIGCNPVHARKGMNCGTRMLWKKLGFETDLEAFIGVTMSAIPLRCKKVALLI